MNKLRFLCSWAFLCISCLVLAQQNPVRFTTEFKKTSDTTAEIVFTGSIASGWHVYSVDTEEGNPATFNLDNSEGVELDGALKAVGTPVKKYDSDFGGNVSYFEGKAVFVQKLKLKGGKYQVTGNLDYLSCKDGGLCVPGNVEFNFEGDAPVVKAADPKVAEKEPLVAENVATHPEDKIDLTEVNKEEESGVSDGEAMPTDSLALDLNAAIDSVQINPEQSLAGTNVDLWRPLTDQLQALDADGEGNVAGSPLWKIFLLGLLGGLIALVTPCVWPIIPMTVSFFLKRAENKSRGIRDAWIYGLSIVVIYMTLGLVITAIFGASALNSLATNAVFNIFFCLLLIVFAASFFGAFDLTLPASWSSKVDSKAEKKGGLIGIFLMAFTLALVSFSCTGPIIGFLLVEVATEGGSFLAPAVGMLGFAIALALPFTLFALFPSWLKSMPKSGGWMNTVKVVLGFIELAFALKFFSVADLAYGWHLLDREVFLSLWIVIFALLGVYLLGKIKFKHDDDNTHIGVVRFFLAIISLAFAMYMVPGLWGAPLKAVSAFAPPMKTQDFNLAPDMEVKPMFTDFEEGMVYAKQHKKPVMIDFTGYGCVNCRKMEAAVWTDERVADKIRNDYVLIQLYVDDKTSLPEPVVVTVNGEQRKLRTVGDKWSYLQSHKFGANAQPFYVLLDADGNLLSKPYSYDEEIDHYLQFLDSGLERYQKK